jgi:hypothetical protein
MSLPRKTALPTKMAQTGINALPRKAARLGKDANQPSSNTFSSSSNKSSSSSSSSDKSNEISLKQTTNKTKKVVKRKRSPSPVPSPVPPPPPVITTIQKYDSTNWKKCWKPRTRVKAVNKGIDYIERISLDVSNFNTFGDQIIQLYYDIARVSGWNEESLRRRCLKYLEHNAERWHYEARDRPWCEDIKKGPTPREIIECIGGMYALERASLSSPYNKKEVSKYIVAKTTDAIQIDDDDDDDDHHVLYDSTILIGWDPLKESPPNKHSELCIDCGQRSSRDRKRCEYCGKKLNVVSKYRIFSNSLINTFYADNTLMPFGGHD